MPSDEAAMRMAVRCADKQGMAVGEIIFLVMYADQMPWYETLKTIEAHGTGLLSEQEEQALRKNCAAFRRVIDRGYDQEQDRWWPFREETERLEIMDAGYALECARDGGSSLEDLLRAESRSGLKIVLSMLLGPRWRQEHTAIRRAANIAQRMRFK